ncbi:MAG: hypothetical protein DMG60_01670 [Acidobacteria bacterium]|nr:MAG: hypothetical protein DMG60_01670 [Acidobacteriota bacterium]
MILEGYPSRVRAILLCTLLFFGVALLGQSAQTEKTFNQGAEALRNGRLDEAAERFSQLTVLAPGFAEAYFNLGLVRLQQRDFHAAILALQKSVNLKPRLRGANLFLGIAKYRNEDYLDAQTALKRELEIAPSNPDVLMWLGVVQLARGENSSAVVSLDKAAKLNPDNVDILYHRGRAHMLVSKESYEQMYKVDPKSWRVHQVLSQSFTEADRLDDAIKECTEAIRSKPDEPGLHEQLADIYWKQNQLEQAETEFENELKVDPQSTSSMYKLAVVSLERSKPAVAAELLKQVVQRSPGSSAEAYYQLGRAQAQLAENEAAIGNFKLAIKQSQQPDTETVRQSYYQLAQLYRRAQHLEESRQALESFLRLKQQADANEELKLQDKLKRAAQPAAR